MPHPSPNLRVLGGVATLVMLLTVPFAGASSNESVGRSETIVPVLTAIPSLLSCSGLAALTPGRADGWAGPVGNAARGAAVPATEPSDYYAIELVPTGRIPGTGLSSGVAYQTAVQSPFFGVALSPSGEYLHDLDLQVAGLKALSNGAYVAWVTDTDVRQIVRLGALDANLRVRGQAAWNKFLVVLTREPGSEPTDTWQGPVVMRGMSRSGRMHTMAGHGPFQTEPCAKYGFR